MDTLLQRVVTLSTLEANEYEVFCLVLVAFNTHLPQGSRDTRPDLTLLLSSAARGPNVSAFSSRHWST
jgi:hypothetical protein